MALFVCNHAFYDKRWRKKSSTLQVLRVLSMAECEHFGCKNTSSLNSTSRIFLDVMHYFYTVLFIQGNCFQKHAFFWNNKAFQYEIVQGNWTATTHMPPCCALARKPACMLRAVSMKVVRVHIEKPIVSEKMQAFENSSTIWTIQYKSKALHTESVWNNIHCRYNLVSKMVPLCHRQYM